MSTSSCRLDKFSTSLCRLDEFSTSWCSFVFCLRSLRAVEVGQVNRHRGRHWTLSQPFELCAILYYMNRQWLKKLNQILIRPIFDSFLSALGGVFLARHLTSKLKKIKWSYFCDLLLRSRDMAVFFYFKLFSGKKYKDYISHIIKYNN